MNGGRLFSAAVRLLLTLIVCPEPVGMLSSLIYGATIGRPVRPAAEKAGGAGKGGGRKTTLGGDKERHRSSGVAEKVTCLTAPRRQAVKKRGIPSSG